LQAASEKADRAQLAGGAMEIVSMVFNDAQELAGHHEILRQSATSSVFATAYEIGNVKLENWPTAPAQIEPIFEQILLPPQRSTLNVEAIRTGWQKRIQYELTAVEFWSRGQNGKGRSGSDDSSRTPEYEKFLVEKVPGLQWQMEMDIFKHGDQAGAAKRMLNHLDKNITHPSSRDWGEQLADLLRPPTGADQ
jgi:hypothetical protein